MRRLAAALLLAALPAAAKEGFKDAADKLKVERAMRLRAEVEKTCDELEPLLAELSALGGRYSGDCGNVLRPERDRLASAIGPRLEDMGQAMGELKNVSRAQDIVAALEAHAGRPRARGSSEAYLSRSIQSTVDRFAKVKGSALALLSQDEAAWREARRDCEARSQRRRWAASLFAVLACAAFLAWRFLGRAAPLALLCLLLPSLPAGASEPLDETKVRRVRASCEEGDALISQLEPVLERLKAQQAGYGSTCRMERLAIERDRTLGEIELASRKLNAVKNDLHALRRNDMFVSFLTKNKPALVGAAIKGGPKPAVGSAPQDGAAQEFFTRSYDACMLRIKDTQYRSVRALEEDELALQAAKEACLDRKVRLARTAALGAFACLLAGGLWLWRRATSGTGTSSSG